MSFPIAVQAGPNNNEDFRPEIDLVAELAGSVIDFAGSMLARVKAGRKSAAVSPQSEAQRLRIAQNPETPAAVLIQLSADSSSAVRSALVFNPAVPASVLFALASDEDRFVRAQAQARISMAA